MKKLTRVLLSVLLVLVLGVTTCLFTGVFSSAQAVATGVSVNFAGVDKEDWVVLNGTTIQDSDFKVTVSNGGDKDIVITDLSHTGINITFANFTEGMTIKAGKEFSFGIAGETNNNSVFTATVTYHLKNYPDATSETATAYIYCTSTDYVTGHSEAFMEGSTGHWGMKAGLNLYPVVDSSYTTNVVSRKQGKMLNFISNPIYNDVHDPHTTTTIYVDKSHYSTWNALGLTFSFNSMVFDEKGNIREYVKLHGLDLTLKDSTTMDMSFNGYSATTKPDQGSATVSSSFDGSEGFFLQAHNEELTSTPFSGDIPDEAVSHIVLKLTGNGTAVAGWVPAGAGSAVTADFEANWNITVYNNNKAALRSKLTELAELGLNKASYSGGWDDYENALKSAYQTLGTIKVTANNVQTALTNVTNAYNNLVKASNNYRYAVVITNHYYYTGKDDSNPVAMNPYPTYDMKVVNGSTYIPEHLTNGDYSKPINRSQLVTSKKIEVDASSNYTTVINQYYWYVNDTSLKALIKEFDNKPTTDTQGNLLYKEESWNAYAAAVQAGRDIQTRADTFQVDVDNACEAIIEARDALERENVDTLWLAEGIDWASQILDNEYIYGDYEYGWDSDELFGTSYSLELLNELEDAYDEANEVLSDENYTKPQADAAAQSLWNAIYNLCVADNRGLLTESNKRHADVEQYGYYNGPFDHPSDPMGLKPLFNDIIDNTSGNYQLNEEDFTPESWYALQDALYGNWEIGWYECATTEEPYAANNDYGELSVPAYSMINNIYFLAKQDDYNACRDNLLAKVNALEYVLEFSDLEALVGSVSEYDLDNYTPSTAQAFNTELQKAVAMLERLAEPQCYGDEDAVSQAQINAQVEALQAAEAALVLKPALGVNDAAAQSVEINEENGYIYGEVAGKTVKQVVEEDLKIINDSEDAYIKVFDKNDRQIARNAKIGTGYRIELYVDDDLCESHQVVVVGDVNGDANINIDDFNAVYDYAGDSAANPLVGPFLVAADLNGDSIVDLCDAAMLL